MASGNIYKKLLIETKSLENYGKESASRQETPQEPGPQSGRTGTGPTIVDTPGPIQNDGTGGRSGRKCWKLSCTVGMLILVHVAKLSFVTAQMWLHGNDRATFNERVQGGHLTLKHILLENWDASWETPPYPPSHGDFAVYTIDDVESGINYAVSRYYNAEKHVAGLYKRMDNDSMEAIIKYFELPDSEDDSHGFTIIERHFPIDHGLTKQQKDNATIYSYSIADELEYLNLSHAMERLLTTTLQFTIYSFRRSLENKKPTFCIRVDGNVTFNDTDINGQVHVNLKTHTIKINCRYMDLSVEETSLLDKRDWLKGCVLAICAISILLVGLDGFRDNKIYDKLRPAEKVPNIQSRYDDDPDGCCICCPRWKSCVKRASKNIWNIYVFVSDVVTIAGTGILLRKSNAVELSELDVCAVVLGTGCILEWLSSFRYFQVVELCAKNSKFHLLYKILRRALPGVLCYMLCVGVIFVGFWLCGFTVLGPYLSKFSTIGSAATALFALANADELYATFYMFDEDKPGDVVVWWFSRVYFTVYICIYIYVVVNVLIGMFTSAYEVITEQYEDAKPLNKALQGFIMHPTSNQLRRCLYDILDSGNFTSNDAKDLKKRLKVFIEENDEHHQNPDSSSETNLQTV